MYDPLASLLEAADTFAAGLCAGFSDDDGDGHWVTIGAQSATNEHDGKTERHGGSPVFIDGRGVITKGAEGLVGHKPSELKDRNHKGKGSPEAKPAEPPAPKAAKSEKTDPEEWPLPTIPSRPKPRPKEEKPEAAEPVESKPAPVPEEPKHEPAEPNAPELSPAAEDIGNRGAAAAGVGGVSGGGDGGTAGQTKPRIVTVCPDLVKPADPGLVPEGLRKHLTDDQIQGAASAIRAMDAHGGFLLADGTGVGKTREILAVAKRYADQGKKVLILSPAEVIKPDWKKGTVAGSFADDSAAMGVGVKLSRGETPLAAGGIHLSTYENLAKFKGMVDGNTVVLWDESHSLKNWGSARSKHGYDISKAAGKVMYATATSVDKPDHVAYLFRAKVFGDRPWDETKTELGLHKVRINVPHSPKGYVEKWEINPRVGKAECYRRLAGLRNRMIQDGLMLKREISLDGLDVHFDRVELPPECHAAMQAIEDHYGADAAGLDRAHMLNAMRRQQEPFKIARVMDHVKKELAAGRQVVVFAARVNKSKVGGDEEGDEAVVESEGTLKSLKEALAAAGVTDVAELHGGAAKTPAQKAKAMNDFQSSKARVIIATIEAGGVGVNLDDRKGDRPRTAIMMTPPLGGVPNVQAAGRIVRMTTRSKSRLVYLFGNTMVDDWNAHLISGKMKAMNAAVGGELGKLDVGRRDDQDSADDADDENPYEWSRPLVRQAGSPAASPAAPKSESPRPAATSPAKREQTATYKGREYRVLWSGPTKFGRRARLQFMDGGKDFWVDESAIRKHFSAADADPWSAALSAFAACQAFHAT